MQPFVDGWEMEAYQVDKKVIKIKSTSIYIQGKKHGQDVNKCFQYSNLSDQSNRSTTDQALTSLTKDNTAETVTMETQPANNWLVANNHNNNSVCLQNLKLLNVNFRSVMSKKAELQVY